MRTRSLRRSVLSVIVGASLLATMTPANAHVQVRWDGNDSRSPLDIEWAGIGHTSRFYFGAARMVNSFRSAMLGRRGDFYVDLDSRGDRSPDYYVWINYSNGIKAKVYKYTTNSSVYVGQGSAWRYDASTVNFRFPRRLVRRSGDYIRWYASTRYFRSVDSYGNASYYWDNAPDRGMRTHNF